MKQTTNDDDDDLVLYVKFHFGLSDAGYHELSMVCQKITTFMEIRTSCKT